MGELRKECPLRHENGNCTPCGGFCTAVHSEICRSVQSAYYTGVTAGIEFAKECLKKQNQ